jgi:hypothetical protein
LRRFYGVTSFSRYPLVEIILYENQDDIFFLWDLGLWTLTIQPSHSFTLAYCRLIFLIFIEFQNIDNIMGSSLKNISSPSIVIMLQSVRPLWLRLFLQSIRIVKLKRKLLDMYIRFLHSRILMWTPYNCHVDLVESMN